MNKYEYLNKLNKKLKKHLPDDEYTNVMQYYAEYFDDAGADKEASVIEELGNPDALAEKIIYEYNGKRPVDTDLEKSDRKKLSVGWIIFIAIIGSPLWLALFFAALGIIIAAVSVLVSIAATGIGLVFGGIGLIAGGFALLFTSSVNGLLACGLGMIVVAVGIGFVLLIVFLISILVKLIMYISYKKKARRAK